jgi:serine/threonine protein kinase
MALTAGTRLGPYELLAPAGAGGMGEVYRARDTRLDRTVAIKVMPPHLASDAQLRQRFEREARAVSSLSHPNICALYDVGHQDGVDYLVMEFLEGQTLAERLAQGPLPAEQALRIGIEISDALDKAHRQGVVHRDLKPGNIMLTKTGAKLLDFGLAKTAGLSPNAPDASTSPTLAKALTAQGVMVGTFQYMAPEQLEGKEADARSDIFAFGAVLYEMLTGRRAFDGKSQASVIAAILNLDPPAVRTLQPLTPPTLERVVRLAMAKDPDDRFQTAHDLKLQLDWIAEGGSQAGVATPVIARRKVRERAAWALAGVALLGAAALAAAVFVRGPQPAERLQAALLAPESFSFDAFDFALSPDGKQVAFVASKPGVRPQLWVQRLDSGSAQPLAGTEGAG